MAAVEARGFDAPDETRTPDKTNVEVVHKSDPSAAPYTFEPGSYVIEPGDDAWVAGEERFVGCEFESRSAEEYGKT